MIERRRAAKAPRIQVRSDGDRTANFGGYASTWDRYDVTDWLGSYTEQLRAGAFRKTIAERAVPLLFNHDVNFPLANTGSGTASLSEDAAGLRCDASLDRRQTYANDLCVSMERGDVSAMSFAFTPVKESWSADYTARTLNEVRLHDVSVVLNPANPSTTAGLRAAMRDALGREGRSLLLSKQELSVRSALPAIRNGETFASEDRDAMFERAFRALTNAGEHVEKRYGVSPARTRILGESLRELRAGRVLSAANADLLNTALSALSDAGTHHDTAHSAISRVLNNAGGVEGMDGNQGAGTGGNPISPQDGAGPRSAAIRLKRKREAELRLLGIRADRQKSPAQLAAEREAELRRLRA